MICYFSFHISGFTISGLKRPSAPLSPEACLPSKSVGEHKDPGGEDSPEAKPRAEEGRSRQCARDTASSILGLKINSQMNDIRMSVNVFITFKKELKTFFFDRNQV